jgi:hypothetical protein
LICASLRVLVLVQSWQLSPRAHKMFIMKNGVHPVAKRMWDCWCGAGAVRLTIVAHTPFFHRLHTLTRGGGVAEPFQQDTASARASSATNTKGLQQLHKSHRDTSLFECGGVKQQASDACNYRDDSCSEEYCCMYRLEAITMETSDVGDAGSGELRTPATHENPHPRTPCVPRSIISSPAQPTSVLHAPRESTTLTLPSSTC